MIPSLDPDLARFDNFKMRFLFDSKLSVRNRIARISALVVVFAFAFISFAEDSEARKRRRRRAKKPRKAVINEPKLFERIGGPKAVVVVVDEWVRASLGDERLNGAFGDTTADPAKVTKLRKALNDQLCALADGTGCAKPDAKAVKEVLVISDDKFVVFADHLFKSMDKSGVREREKNELLSALGEARADALPAQETETE